MAEDEDGNLVIPITKTVFGEPENLPEPSIGRNYIVSQIIKTAFPDRKDLFVPVGVVYDKDRKPLGCTSLGI
jgi:hypothetical protein